MILSKQVRPRHFLFFGVAALIIAALLLQSYLAFHTQVYDACRLTYFELGSVPEPFKATCIQVGAFDTP